MIISYKYEEQGKPHGYEGVLYEKDEIKSIFPNHIKKSLRDTEGTNTLVSNAENYLSTTGFDNEGLKEILVDIYQLDLVKHNPFRVGEAFAEFHLEQNYKATFYYNELSDARNPNGNKTGADLLGTVDLLGETVFLFGEVKTSSEQKSPPNVLYGNEGMIEQLQNLAKDDKIRNILIKVLGHKINQNTNSFAQQEYYFALKSYINSNNKKFHLFGVLVRDTAPEVKDIEARYKTLAKEIETIVGLKLIALYVPFKKEEWNAIINTK